MYRPKNCKKCGGKMQQGGLQPYTQSNTPHGSITPTGQSSLASNSQLTPAQMQELAARYGFRTDSNQNFQQDLFNYAQKNQPSAYQSIMNKFGQTNAGTFVDGKLGARTTDLLAALQPPRPQQQAPQQAELTEWLYGPDKHSLGMASRPYRDSQSISDPGILDKAANSPQYVDFMYNQPESQNTDPDRGRYRIPYDIWQNQVTRGTGTVQDPSWIDQYRMPSANIMASNVNMKMKGGKLQKMQTGGMPKQQDFPDYESWQSAMDQWMGQNQMIPQSQGMNMLQNFNKPLQDSDIIPGVNAPYPEVAQQRAPLNSVQDAIQKGIIEAPNNFNGTADQWYANTDHSQSKRKGKNPYQTLQNVGIGLQAATAGIGWLAGAIERGRQNKYDMTQQTALGQMNPMQASDFQPNPYSLYAKYGGNLKTIMRDFQKWSNDAGPMDMTEGKGNPEMKKGGYEIDRMLIVRKILPELLNFGRMGHHYKELGGEMKKGGNWIQGAVNPDHKGYCTPMTKSTCTPRRKAFAMTMKKHHGFHKK